MGQTVKIVMACVAVVVASTSCAVVAGLKDRQLGDDGGAGDDSGLDGTVHEAGDGGADVKVDAPVESGGDGFTCTPESDQAYCAMHNAACGTPQGPDNCNQPRTGVNCGMCTSPQTCDNTFQCSSGSGGCDGGCTPESDTQFCSSKGASCGSATGTDNCNMTRMVASCGMCTMPQTCGGGGTPNQCGCMPESDQAFCMAKNAMCGSVSGIDNCGQSRTVTSCGSCTMPQTCGGGGMPNRCGCTPSCPTCVSGPGVGDNCGGFCGVNCPCTSGTCSAGQCVHGCIQNGCQVSCTPANCVPMNTSYCCSGCVSSGYCASGGNCGTAPPCTNC